MSENVTQAAYVSSGPAYPGETSDQAMAENAIHHLAGHLLARRFRQSMRPGHGFEHEPTDAAEKAAQHVAQNAYRYSHAETSAAIRAALRPGT
jgi:hypothetical protein